MVTNIKSNQGFVLVVALVFLVALTAVASALMLNSTTDMKMSGASQEKVIATQEAISSIDEVIMQQVTLGATNLFTNSVFEEGGNPGVSVNVTAENTNAVINNAIVDNLLVDCPAMKGGSSNDRIKCTALRVTVVKSYGNNETSSVVVNAGIAQQIRPNGR
jgi:Tfp pilus assembly protein PilX